MDKRWLLHTVIGSGATLSDFYPNRQQILMIAQSKHLYALKNGDLRHQAKELDANTPGDKRLLTRLIVQDVDTRVLYAEMVDQGRASLLAFLGRAWKRKGGHPMHGAPQKLLVPKSAFESKKHSVELEIVQKLLPGIVIEKGPGGFKGGAAAAREYEKRLRITEGIHLGAVQEGADVFSGSACIEAIVYSREVWEGVPDLPPAFEQTFDKLFGSLKTDWRTGKFARMFDPRPVPGS
jgi:hypothetical protein